jgi:hypothetical protein
MQVKSQGIRSVEFLCDSKRNSKVIDFPESETVRAVLGALT